MKIRVEKGDNRGRGKRLITSKDRNLGTALDRGREIDISDRDPGLNSGGQISYMWLGCFFLNLIVAQTLL